MCELSPFSFSLLLVLLASHLLRPVVRILPLHSSAKTLLPCSRTTATRSQSGTKEAWKRGGDERRDKAGGVGERRGGGCERGEGAAGGKKERWGGAGLAWVLRSPAVWVAGATRGREAEAGGKGERRGGAGFAGEEGSRRRGHRAPDRCEEGRPWRKKSARRRGRGGAPLLWIE